MELRNQETKISSIQKCHFLEIQDIIDILVLD
jgi:hypothetical protein